MSEEERAQPATLDLDAPGLSTRKLGPDGSTTAGRVPVFLQRSVSSAEERWIVIHKEKPEIAEFLGSFAKLRAIQYATLLYGGAWEGNVWVSNHDVAVMTGQTAPVWQPTHMHRKSGGLYKELRRGSLEASLAAVVIYENEGGAVWVRPVSEFDDGRFEKLPPVDQPTVADAIKRNEAKLDEAISRGPIVREFP